MTQSCRSQRIARIPVLFSIFAREVRLGGRSENGRLP